MDLFKPMETLKLNSWRTSVFQTLSYASLQERKKMLKRKRSNQDGAKLMRMLTVERINKLL
jgi:hypothetical protein